jgi:hypothetical protein
MAESLHEIHQKKDGLRHHYPCSKQQQQRLSRQEYKASMLQKAKKTCEMCRTQKAGAGT